MRRSGGALLILAVVAACAPRDREIVLASTTSVDDSGLLDAILPAFHEAHPEFQVKVIAVGSGEALSLAARGDADLVIAHSPAAERQFMADGHGRARTPLMRNDFVIVGPEADPAGVGCAASAGVPADAMRAIAGQRAPFVSRGDHSGTHARELELFADAGVDVDPAAGWYMAIGQGMGEALRVASERQAYTLTDRATYLALRDNLMLAVLVDGGGGMENEYSVIVSSRGRNREGADALATWLSRDEGRMLIGAFGRERFGRALFDAVH